MNTLLEELKKQPETIKPEQKAELERVENNEVSNGSHCQGGGGDW